MPWSDREEGQDGKNVDDANDNDVGDCEGDIGGYPQTNRESIHVYPSRTDRDRFIPNLDPYFWLFIDSVFVLCTMLNFHYLLLLS